MSRTSRVRALLSAALLAAPSTIEAADATDPVGRAVAAMTRAAGAPVAVTRSPVTGLATFLRPARPIAVPGGAGRTVEQAAAAFVAEYGDAFGVPRAGAFRVRRVRGPDTLGMEHVRVQQLHEGVPVTGGHLAVHLRDGSVVAVNAKTVPGLDGVGTTPTITPAAAEAVARALVEHDLGARNATIGIARLEVFNRGLLEGRPYPTRLAWFVEGTGPSLRERIWIDAHTGAVLLHFSQIADVLDREVYDAEDMEELPGTLVRDEGDTATGDAETDRAYDYAGDTYDYFDTEHGWDSYDDAGATLVLTVHWCFFGEVDDDGDDVCPWRNAAWNGTQVRFGDGFTSDDVVAHEITHALTEYSAGLYYYMQSGALNESFSDIFGETVDLTNGTGTDTDAVRWHHGEDIVPSGTNRNMLTPTANGDPGRMSDPLFVCDPSADNGGVHSNSGVPNHAYALMVDGGTYNGVTLTGIGLEEAALIQFRALTVYLLPASDFRDAYDALNQSCADLIGTAGITSDDCTAVTAVLDAVEMAAPWPCSPAQQPVAALCPSGSPLDDLFFDDFETPSAGNWVEQEISGRDHWSYPPTVGAGMFPVSGALNLWGRDLSGVGDSAMAMTADVAIPAGARLQFAHSYEFEIDVPPAPYPDGGVVEYSVDGGDNWIDAGSLISLGAGYGGTIMDDDDDDESDENPLSGRDAFVGASFGYTASQLDLGSLAGESVRFRFRIGTDEGRGERGWFIDDVRIYTCACGNGDVDAGEDCDDGNGVDCDGCDNDCTDSATCGNGTRCGSEDCDDGNTAAGDCCSASCEYEASGADCDDGEACTLDDTCDGSGVCVGGDPSDDVCDDDNLCSMETCDAAVGCVYTPADCDDGDVCSQDTCDPATGCANMTVPRSGCRMPEKTMLKIRLTTDGIKDKLDWTWKKGGKTLLGSLGDPIDSTDYAMCLYSLPDEEVLFSAAIPGGGTCDDDPCWSAIGTTINQFRYRDPAAATDGFTKIQLKTGAEGRASVTVKAQGVALPDVSLPVTMPITMQLVNDDGECWEATYTSEPRANDAERLSVQER